MKAIYVVTGRDAQGNKVYEAAATSDSELMGHIVMAALKLQKDWAEYKIEVVLKLQVED